MLEKIVQTYSNNMSLVDITKHMQRAKRLTMDKMIRAIAEECIHPFIAINSTAQTIELYTAQICVIYDKTTYHINLNDEQIDNPVTFLKWCQSQGNESYDYMSFIKEIENHLINQSLSFIHCADKPKSHHALLNGEQWVITGHNIHPCAKTKLGMSFEDVMQYAPEYNQVFELNWILVKKSLLFNNLEETFIQQLKAFSGYNKSIDDVYYIIPVHPYQYQHVIAQVYQEEIAAKDIVMLNYKGGAVKSTSSFRTVCPLEKHYPILKLPVHAQMTSTVRSISNNSVINSKKVSNYFRIIYEQDDTLRTLSTPIMEFGGMTYQHSNKQKQRNLSFILRENSTRKFEQYSDVYAATCLFEQDETGEKIYKQHIQQSQLRPEEWFKCYTSLLLSTAIPLMTKYGIGLEAHMQNISVAFIHGVPKHIYFKDFGGLRIDTSRTLGKLSLTQGLTSTSAAGMHEKLLNTLISNHISTLISHMVKDYHFKADELWTKIAQQIHAIFNTFDQSLPGIQKDYEQFTSHHIKQKALMTMRLSTLNEDIYIEKENPLYAQFVDV
ncbi:IucA/IucC family protein [Macrococcus animalis]|uniref:IucA/IucC family protein n=1 Tax=Macrococcus animalis TaxID=3395467 RepID=UPI0039BECA94